MLLKLLNFRQGRLKVQALIAAVTLALLPSVQVLAQSQGESDFLPKSVEYDVDGVRVALPDWMQINFSNLPPISSSGEIVVPISVVKELGYDPSRTWTAGQTADSYMMMGDFGGSFQLQQFALKNIAEIVGKDLSELNLKDYALVSWQTAESLVEAIPGLENLPINKVKPLYDLFTSFRVSFSRTSSIREVLQQYPALKDSALEELGENLANYNLDSIPGLSETPIEKYQDWQQSYIDQVPGLNQVPFGFFPFTFNNVGFSVLGRADVVFSSAEVGDPLAAGYFLTGGANGGSARKPKIKPEDCQEGKPCSYLELEDLFGIGDGLHGKRWGSGETQQVEGGFGFLKVVNGGKEPTGLLPYGSVFKVVMTGANESEGVAEFGLYFRACVETLFLGYHCSPYSIGPVPWFPVKENDPVIVLSTSSSPKVNIPENYQQEIDEIIAAVGGNDNSCAGGCIEGDGQTTGTFTHPIALGTRVSSPYGWRKRPISGKTQFHHGIDYAAPLGTPVKSVDGGKVIRVSSNSCSDFGKSNAKKACGGELGNWMDVRHADGKIVRYGHLQKGSIKVKPGMSVSKGQVIAGVGSSGWSTGPHLDLRVHDGRGNYENPDRYIKR